MHIRYDLFAQNDHPPSPMLVNYLAEEVLFPAPHHRRMRIGDYLGHSLAESIVTPVGVSAISVFCWDEKRVFGDFRAGAPALWLANKVEANFSGDWTAEGYGIFAKNDCDVARWIAWDNPVDEDDSLAVCRALSATFRMKELMKTLDPLLAHNLVDMDPSAKNSAAFIAAVATDPETASGLVEVAKAVIGDYLESCMD